MIRKIAVLGAGTMGHGIAEAFAMYGYEVNLFDSNFDRLQLAKKEIEEELKLLVEEGFISDETAKAAVNHISLGTSMQDSVKDRDYVIEAVPEILDIKQQVFRQLDEYCPPHTILASNTSSLELSRMMELMSEQRKARTMINHWFNPAYIMPIVELSYFGNMPEDIYREVEQLYHSIKKQTVKVLMDIPGLIATRLQQCLAREVYYLLEMGAVDAENIDKALKFGPAFRHVTSGLLEVGDLGGLDIWSAVADNTFKDLANNAEANAIIRNKAKEGKLGLKSGEGFYQYDPESSEAVKERFTKRLIHQLKATDYYIGNLNEKR